MLELFHQILSSAIKQITVGDANLRIVVVGNFGTSTTPSFC